MKQNQFMKKVGMKAVSTSCIFLFYTLSFVTSFFSSKALEIFSLAVGLVANILMWLTITKFNFIKDCDERDEALLYKNTYTASLIFIAILLSGTALISLLGCLKENLTLTLFQVSSLIWMIVTGFQAGIYGSFYLKEKKPNAE